MKRIAIAVLVALSACGKEEHGGQPPPAPGLGPVHVLAGEFTMGEPGRPDETPHTVSVSAFIIDPYPVTQ